MTSLVGQTLNKRYRLDALLGDGGMEPLNIAPPT